MKGSIERIDVGPFEIRESKDGANTVVEVKGAAARALAGGEARAVDAARTAGARVVIVNAEPTPFDAVADAIVRTPIGEALPHLLAP